MLFDLRPLYQLNPAIRMPEVFTWIDNVPHQLLELLRFWKAAHSLAVEYFFFVDTDLECTVDLTGMKHYSMNIICEGSE